MKLYYNWVNEPQVRKNSCDSKKHISWHSHKNWFRKKIQDKSSTLYVFEKKDVEAGQVRFEKQNKIVRINFSICKKFRGCGLGKKMLTMAIRKYKLSKSITFIGEVKTKNLPSIKIFKSLGFIGNISNKIYYFKKIYI